MTPDELVDAIRVALHEAAEAGELADPGAVEMQVRASARGWSTPVALRVASSTGMPVGQVAATLADRLAQFDGVEAVSVRDGFLDVISGSTVAVERALAEGEAYGRSAGDRIGPPARWVAAAASMPRTLENPVFTVQLAHARLAAASQGPSTDISGDLDQVLVTAVAEFPASARRATDTGDPDVLARFLERVARQVHNADDLPGDLCAAVALVLGNGLAVLGTTAPARV